MSTRTIFPNSNCKLEGVLFFKTTATLYSVLAKALWRADHMLLRLQQVNCNVAAKDSPIQA